MKRLFILLFSIFICYIAHADTETINWYVDGTSYATTTCQTGGDIILPNTPYKYGYTFQGWSAYTLIEYLESTGTQWIDTGIIANDGCKTEAVIAPKFTNGIFNMQLGSIGDQTANPDSTRNMVAMYNNMFSFQKLNNATNYCHTVISEEPVHIYFNSIGSTLYGKINDIICVNTATGTLSNQLTSIKIGYSDYSSSVRSQKNYYVKIWNSNNTLVRDFIPVLDGSGTPCMYDKVTHQFFYNQGTGNFIAGPVINQ